MGWTLAELAEILDAQLVGEPLQFISRPVPAGSNDPEGVTFAESDSYFQKAIGKGVGAILVADGQQVPGENCLIVESPRMAFFKILTMSQKQLTLSQGVHESAVINESAKVDPSAKIGAFVVIEEDAVIGPKAQICPFSYIGPRCSVGADSMVLPGSVLLQDVRVGDRTIVHSGVVLGADGFGYVWNGQNQIKIPQVGGVKIGNDVEVGANTTIDRATSGDTKIGNDVKIDNLVQIGHNSEIGDHTVIAGLVGISGSVEIGKRVTIGGQCGMADHLKIGDDIQLAGRTGLLSDLIEPGVYFGVPPVPIKQGMRNLALQQRLPELLQRIRDLEKEVEKLKNGE